MKPRIAPLCLALIGSLAAAPAMAQISLSGQAAMGLDRAESGDVSIRNKTRLDIDAARVTDGGITFGARIRVEDDTGRGGCRRAGRRDCGLPMPMLYLQFGEN
ncbi:porin [Szabonella alba]|uniref:Porin n=1 Tax=Szabonella alba TaxID=2804194 RepID=A0A8K0Y0R7_9RHOB|nr:porin [Szabonella alba]MBL4918106.1 porin [Szabonella alba]